GMFLLLVLVPPIHHLATKGGEELQAVAALCRAFPDPDLQAYERNLAGRSALRQEARRIHQRLLYHVIRRGGLPVHPGADGFLFSRQDLQFCTDTHLVAEQSTAAILDFHSQLQARGIHLVLAPIPVPPVIYPEKVWSSYPQEHGPAWNPHYGEWVSG